MAQLRTLMILFDSRSWQFLPAEFFSRHSLPGILVFMFSKASLSDLRVYRPASHQIPVVHSPVKKCGIQYDETQTEFTEHSEIRLKAVFSNAVCARKCVALAMALSSDPASCARALPCSQPASPSLLLFHSFPGQAFPSGSARSCMTLDRMVVIARSCRVAFARQGQI